MNYDLCKKLKDAGFPQHTRSKEFFINSETGERPHNPTLEELIEACGKGELVLNTIDGKYTNARIVGLELNGEGSNPTEAVAYLYLVLYDKGNGTSNKNKEAH